MMLMLETYEDNRLRALYQKQAENEYYYDKHVQYKNFGLHIAFEKEVDTLEKILHARRLFNGNPYEWEGNEITIRKCHECELECKCKVWNEYLNRPRKVSKIENDNEKYDASGNRMYQIYDLNEYGII